MTVPVIRSAKAGSGAWPFFRRGFFRRRFSCCGRFRFQQDHRLIFQPLRLILRMVRKIRATEDIFARGPGLFKARDFREYLRDEWMIFVGHELNGEERLPGIVRLGFAFVVFFEWLAQAENPRIEEVGVAGLAQRQRDHRTIPIPRLFIDKEVRHRPSFHDVHEQLMMQHPQREFLAGKIWQMHRRCRATLCINGPVAIGSRRMPENGTRFAAFPIMCLPDPRIVRTRY